MPRQILVNRLEVTRLSRRLRKAIFATTVPLLLVSPANAAASCDLESQQSPYASVRRAAAVRFVQTVMTAQQTMRRSVGRWGRLSELPEIGTPPVGFVPSITVDAYDYVVMVKDIFDACGYVVVGDSSGIAYEGVVHRAEPSDEGQPSMPSDLSLRGRADGGPGTAVRLREGRQCWGPLTAPCGDDDPAASDRLARVGEALNTVADVK